MINCIMVYFIFPIAQSTSEVNPLFQSFEKWPSILLKPDGVHTAWIARTSLETVSAKQSTLVINVS